MDQARFDAMVAALEHESAQAPRRYLAKVAMLALAGFAILALLIGFAGLGLLLLAGLVIATLATGGSALILLFKLGKLLVLLAIPLWLLLRSSLSALLTRLPAPQGLEITRDQAPALFAAIDRMRERMKGPRFHHVLLTDEVNAAVVQRPLFGLVGLPRNYLVLGLPLLEASTPDEALAVVAHEYGHLAGSHGRFAAFIYRLRLTWGSIQDLAQRWQGWASRPLRALVGWYAPYFNAYTFVLARANEYQADAASAELVGAGTAASALKRVNIVVPQYEHFNEKTFGAVRDDPAPPADRAMRWAGVALRGVDDGQGRTWLGEALVRAPHPLDTHPALRLRLAALPGQTEHIDELPAALVGASAAVAWLGAALDGLRDTMQSDWKARLAEPWKEKHDELQRRLARLAELERMDTPGLDEREERLCLALELRPEDDHLPALAGFNAEHPGRALTLFLEGRERLAHDDETGLALLERAIEAGAEYTRAASERAWDWLTRKGDPRAAAWQQRWLDRLEFEARRDHELSHFDVRQPLQAHGLDAQTLARVAELLRDCDGVRAAYLARRVLPSAPEIPTYVLGIEMTRWAAFRSRGPQIVEQLAAREWPLHLFIVAFDGQHKATRKQMLRLDGARLATG